MALWFLPLPILAQTDDPCGGVNVPGATLLIPYFEVDTADGNGRSTLISVANDADESVLARITLWTAWGLPTFAFDARLEAKEVLPLNLRSLLVAGQLPAQSLGGQIGCAQQELDPTTLIAQHSGLPHPQDGLCYSSPTEDTLATGFVTVDTIQGCAQTVIYPKDEGYFRADGSGLASSQNVLWGDVILVDPSQDLAQGFEAIPVVAEGASIGTGAGQVRRSFYSRSEFDVADQRLPLGLSYRSRFLTGGAFDGGTQLLIWTGWSEIQVVPGSCDTPPTSPSQWDGFGRFEVWDEAGNPLPAREFLDNRRTQRLDVGTELVTDSPFGSFEVFWRALFQFGGVSPPPQDLVQLWVLPLMTAQNRFSVGLRATETDNYCAFLE